MNPSALTLGIACLGAQTLLGALVSSTPSMKDYVTGTEKLTVYTDVPGHQVSMSNGYASRAKSDIYEIWVRSAASDNVWVQCFANMTYNRGLEMPLMTDFQTPTATHAYQKFTAGWTHTYANIEMSENSPVEVEIRKIGSTTLNGSSVILKSAVHPAHKIIAGSKFDANGRVYFKIDKPSQVVIDINGQMDDHNAAYPSNVAGGRMPDGSPVHSVAFYANPIMAKPVAGPANTIVTVNPMVKLHSWRVNGDGFGGYSKVEDSFFRTSDDSTYVRDWRRRCTFWKDTNANIFRFVNYKSGGLDDCDVIYARWRDPRGVGSIFEFANGGYDQAEVLDLNLTLRNIRFHDKHSNPRRLFSMDILQSYRGLVFENISAYLPKNDYKSILVGSEIAPWYERLVFKNVTYKTSEQSAYETGTLLTAANFNDYFETNEFVKYVLFDHPRNLTVAVTSDSAKGFVTKTPNQATHVETTLASLTATALPGYVFIGWVGLNADDPTTDPTANPVTIRMLENRNVTANFGLANIADPVVIATASTGSWVVPPGVYSATIQAWGGGGAGGSAQHTLGSSSVSVRGGGGTGGSFSSRTLRVTPGQVIDYSVGAGGVGSTLPAGQAFPSDSNSGDGGGSSATVNGQSALSAVGGLGGKNKSGTTSSTGGFGRTAPTSGNTGDAFYYGGNGSGANFNGTGGGGGSAGSLGSGGHAPGPPEAGIAGLGGGADGAGGHNNTANGNIGGFPGGGGSGAGVRNSTAASTLLIGGTGGDGKMVVTYNTLSFSLTTQAVNGTIDLSPTGGTYPSGASVSVTAVPNPGYQFIGWSGALTGAEISTTLVMDRNKSVTATFTPDSYATWAGAGKNFEDDANNDGMENGLAWFLGADNPNDHAADLLPKPTENAGALVLEFDCLNATDRGTAIFEVQYGSDLDQINAWTGTPIPGATGTFNEGVVDFVVTDPESVGGQLKVVATIPAGEAAAGRIFGRIKGSK